MCRRAHIYWCYIKTKLYPDLYRHPYSSWSDARDHIARIHPSRKDRLKLNKTYRHKGATIRVERECL